MKPEVGDRVVVLVGGPYHNAAGDTGEIVATDEGIVGVCFDRYVDGNNLKGACEMGYGVWFDESNVKVLEAAPIPDVNVDLMALF